jgi:DME family drug/metabolite transporter
LTERHSASGIFFILTAALLWSTGGLFIKSVTLDAYGISLWRSGFAAVTLFLFYRKIVPTPVRTGSDISGQLIITVIVYAALLVLFVLATKLTTSANAIFLQFTAPIYVLIAEPLLNKTRIKNADIVSVLITIGAMGLFFIGKFDSRSTLGNILALTSGICFAGYTLLLKHERTGETGRWQSVIIGHIIIVALMLVITSTSSSQMIPTTFDDLWRLIFLGVMQIGVPYSLFTIGIKHVSALDALLLSMVEPVLNPVWVYLGIGETPSIWAITGGIIILIVIALRVTSTIRKHKSNITPN